MALTRAQLIAAVAGELAGVLTLGGFTSADTATNMKEPTDRAFRALGVGQNVIDYGQAPDGDEEKWLAYLRYFTIDKAVWNTTAKMNVKAGSASANAREQHENLLRLQASALALAQSFGLQVPGAGQSAYLPIPFGGGIDQAAYDATADDTSRVPPLFSRRDLPTVPSWSGEPW